jgi:hypothetical protein
MPNRHHLVDVLIIEGCTWINSVPRPPKHIASSPDHKNRDLIMQAVALSPDLPHIIAG